MFISCICWAHVFLVDDIVHAFGEEIGLFDDVDRSIYHLKFFLKVSCRRYHMYSFNSFNLT